MTNFDRKCRNAPWFFNCLPPANDKAKVERVVPQSRRWSLAMRNSNGWRGASLLMLHLSRLGTPCLLNESLHSSSHNSLWEALER